MPEDPVQANKAVIRECWAAWDAGDPAAVASFVAAEFSTTYTDWTGVQGRVAPADVHDGAIHGIEPVEVEVSVSRPTKSSRSSLPNRPVPDDAVPNR
jgi:hypothetical protein